MHDTHRIQCTAEVKAIDVATRTVTHLISTSSVDRAGDIVDVAGWKLDNYASNPVVLVDHDYSIRSLVGTGHPFVEKDGLYSDTRFAETELGEAAFELVKQKIARAWSVGFRGLKRHMIRDGESVECPACQAVEDPGYGVHFLQQDLLEYSLVAVPMNPDAVTMALQKGIPKKQIPMLFREMPPAETARQGAKAAISGETHPLLDAGALIRRKREVSERIATLRSIRNRRN